MTVPWPRFRIYATEELDRARAGGEGRGVGVEHYHGANDVPRGPGADSHAAGIIERRGAPAICSGLTNQKGALETANLSKCEVC